MEHGLCYVNKYVNNETSMRMAGISLLDNKLYLNNGSFIPTLENPFISTYLLSFCTRVQTKKIIT